MSGAFFRSAAAALLSGAVLLLAAAPAQAEPVWVEGAFQETNISSCIQAIPEKGTSAFLAYQEPAANTPPRVGDVYYVGVVVAGLGNTCSGTIYNPQVKLPPGTAPAVSAQNPVYCFASPSPGAAMQRYSGMCAGIETLGNGNVQIDSSPAWAGTFNGNPIAPFFPIAQGYFEEENFPVISSLPLSGAQKIESDIYTTDEGGQHLYPWVAPVVLAREEAPGGEPGPGPGGGSGGGSPEGGGSGGSGGGGSGGGSPGGGGTSGSPGVGGSGGRPDGTGSSGDGGGAQPTGTVPRPRLTKPKIDGARRTATFVFHAPASAGATHFSCSVDGKPYRPCRSPKTYKGLKNGRHTFAVKALAASTSSGPARVKFTIR